VPPRQIRQVVQDELATLLPTLRRLPRRAERIADSIEHGRLSLTVRTWADPGDRRWLTCLVHQALLTLLSAAAASTAARLLSIQRSPEVTDTVELNALIGYGLLIAAGLR
jgi:ubiquinone biosynthesis protein